ncbi:MAG: SusE domain-containing protein [Tannerellaceae bacterium]|jgi:hypothetical protein|nr:SusE domain-containing protein [Tannerellaceae bacterium]
MKTICKIILLASFFALLTLFANNCSDNHELNLNVTAVTQLNEPADDISVPLQSSASAAVYFEWEPAIAEDGEIVVYEVVFDREDGDFSNPVARIASDGKGLRTYASITHKQLNKIAAMMGIAASATGKYQWTVFSSKGVMGSKAAETRMIEVTRLAGFADIPAAVYVIGEGSESGSDFSQALKMRIIEEGEFETFTKLTAGQSYYFVDAISGTPKQYYIDGELLKENGTSMINQTGIYKITLDFNSGIAVYSKVNAVKWYHCNSDTKNLEIPYVGRGVWALNKHTMTAEDFGSEQTNPRYRFVMEYSDGTETVWGPANFNEDAMPGDTPAAAYFYAKEYTMADGVTPFVPKWKRNLPNGTSWIGYTYNMSLILQATTPYTHTLIETTPDDPDPDPGPNPAPTELYIMGEGSEGGSVLTQAVKMTSIEDGVFKMFTQLTAGQNYYFVDANIGTPKQYSTTAGVLNENGTSIVSETGIYKIVLNFIDNTAVYSKISAVKWFHCNTGNKALELPYTNRGVWALNDYTMTDENFVGGDNSKTNPRYRFVMEYSDGTETVWGPVNTNEDGTPNGDPAYFHAKEYMAADLVDLFPENERQFKPKWKRTQNNSVSWVGYTYDLSLILQADNSYTHTLIEK